jgi:C1A family cysteine protease
VAFVLNGFLGSRLFLHYNERLLENTTGEDSGALMSDGIRVFQTYGLVAEKPWPYQITRFTATLTPSCYSTALLHRVVFFARVKQDKTSMQAVLASGFPFSVGIAVYDSFESYAVARTGAVPMPRVRAERFLGGHTVLCVGYDDARGVWIMRNSWGDKGYFYMPFTPIFWIPLSLPIFLLSTSLPEFVSFYTVRHLKCQWIVGMLSPV